MATTGQAGGGATAPQGGATPTTTQAVGANPGQSGAEAAITAVSNGLQGLTGKLTQLSDAMVKLRADQVMNSRATELREKNLADKVSKTWDDALKNIATNAAALGTAQAANTTTVDAHTQAVEDNIKQTMRLVEADKEAEAASKRTTTLQDLQAEASKKSYASLKTSISSITAAQNDAKRKLADAGVALEKLQLELETKGHSPALTAQIEAATDEYKKNRIELASVNDQYNVHAVALGKHSTVIGTVTKKLQDLGTSAALGAAAVKLYNEAQAAKSTAAYGSIQDFMFGQMRALWMGISSKTYTELNAQTRGSAMTAESQSKFNTQFEAGIDKMSQIAGTREDGARLAASVFQSTATVGISSKIASDRMDDLGDGFNRLAKITGKTVGEMAELTFAIAKDTDHRAVMLGMTDKERATYLLKQQADVVSLKLQGYSIEQAQELQKLAMQTRTQQIQERISKQAGLQQSMYTAASMFRGPQSDALRATAAKQAELDTRGRGTLTPEQRIALEKEKKINTAKYVAQLEEIEAAQGSSEVAAGNLAKVRAQIADTSGGITAGVNSAMEKPNKETIEAKVNERAQGADPISRFITASAGYASALMGNTLAVVALTAVMYMVAKQSGMSLGLDMLKKPKFLTTGKGLRATRMATVAAGRTARAVGAIPGAAKVGGAALSVGKGIATAATLGGIVKGGLGVLGGGGVGALAGMGADYLGDSQREKGNVKTGAALSVGGSALSMAATGAMLGAFTGPLAPIMTPLLATAGGLYGAYQGYQKSKPALDAQANVQAQAQLKLNEAQTSLAAKTDPKIAAAAAATAATTAAAATAKESASTDSAKADQTKPAIPQATLDELSRQFYTAAIDYYKQVDPSAERDIMQKQAALHARALALRNLDKAAFNAPMSTQGG